MIEQYLAIEKSKDFLPSCIYETPVWRYLLYKSEQEIFNNVTIDHAVPSEPFRVKSVIIDGIEYTVRNGLDEVRSNARSWAQDGEVLYVHYTQSFPAWLLYKHVYGVIIGRSSGKTRFFDGGMKYSAGLSAKFTYKIEADNLEYAKMKLISGAYTIPAQGEFDSLIDILGNNIETSYSLDGAARIPLNSMFIEDAEITLESVSIKAADKREKLNVPVAAGVFTREEYPYMKEEYYGKNKQEVFGFCRGVPAVCLDQREVKLSDGANKTFRTYRAASVITSVTKIEVKMTQPQTGQNNSGDVWVEQAGSLSGNGTFTLSVAKCLPILPNEQPDYGNEPYEARVTGTFRTNGTHWAILSYLLETAIGNTWTEQCETDEMQKELAGTGTVGLFIEKETKIFDIIETLQSSGIYGWQLHDYRGRLTARKDNNARLPLPRKIKGADIMNINSVGVSLSMNDYATFVQVEYQRNYSEKKEEAKNILQDSSNRKALFPIYRNDKTYTAQSYLEYDAEARACADYLLSHFITPRIVIKNIELQGEQWLGLRLYDILGVYLEQELKQETLPVMLMVLSNEIRKQESSVSGNAQVIEYVLDNKPEKYREFGGNILIKVMRIEHDIANLKTVIDGIYIRKI